MPSVGNNLVKLNLSDNVLTKEVVPELAKAVAAQRTLRVLNLNDTSLGPDGVTEMCRVLIQSYNAAADGAPRQQLEEIGFALNEVDPAAARVREGCGGGAFTRVMDSRRYRRTDGRTDGRRRTDSPRT